ncbi:hypothetical protein N9802_07980 [Amylibacter sp.]|nr:hypothetical protein [Amylibacter sp.]
MLNCIFLGCNKKQIPYLLTLLQQGFKVFVFDREAMPIKVENCEIFRIAYSDVDQIIQCLIMNNVKIDLLFSAGDQASQFYLSKIAEYFDLPFGDGKIIERILDKSKFYQDFEKYNINIPNTKYVITPLEYKNYVTMMLHDNKKIYIKSDFSKNPRYIYTATDGEIPELNWNKDRYFQKYYILQPEIRGDNLRINIVGNEIFVFDFFSGNLVTDLTLYSDRFKKLIECYKKIIEYYDIQKYVVKFDAIYNGKEFFTLDIGIDPPQRLLKLFADEGKNFYEFYLDHYNSINFGIK